MSRAHKTLKPFNICCNAFCLATFESKDKIIWANEFLDGEEPKTLEGSFVGNGSKTPKRKNIIFNKLNEVNKFNRNQFTIKIWEQSENVWQVIYDFIAKFLQILIFINSNRTNWI